MLHELTIRNYALIDSLSLSFQKGFTVLSGETGAGKSIIVGALSFLLGAKTDATVVRAGSESAVVQAVISVQPHSEAYRWLEGKNIELEKTMLTVRRTMRNSGRGSIFIQNVRVSRSDLAECMRLLFDIHGQQNHESLVYRNAHRVYVDQYAGIEGDVEAYRRLFNQYNAKKQRIETVRVERQTQEAHVEMLQYAIDEIDSTAPRIGEIKELEAEAKKLADFERLAEYVKYACDLLFDTEESVVHTSRKICALLEVAATIDEHLEPLRSRTNDWYYEMEDLSTELHVYRDTLHYEPGRLNVVEERLSQLFRLKKKYGSDEESILAYREKSVRELEHISQTVENLVDLHKEIDSIDRLLDVKAEELSLKRQKAALDLSQKINAILGELGMPETRFCAVVHRINRNVHGIDAVDFFISANHGEPLRELAQIASGGELSRIMLAIKTVLSVTDTRETLIFDEIDTGIGGVVANAVGEYLEKIAQHKQIFCVTHVASIAVRANNHFKVGKKDEHGRTVTRVLLLDKENRRAEIARMLSGDSGDIALAHAAALLERYGK
ncbi:MAG: DNA repair protein RecN [Treponema sp.]|jgi:DNA repair protein RecN (Recombination protein N)|nr:DNA repair protein RecN [Treponema sp.]